MAARKKIRHDENTRAKIQAAQLINRLQKHVMATTESDILEASQVSAAKVLLDKVLPNLAMVEVEADVTQHTVSAEPMSAETWAEQHVQDERTTH